MRWLRLKMSYTDVWFLTMWSSVFALAITATVIWEVSSTGEECSLNSSPEDDSSYSDSDSQSWENDYPRQPPTLPNNYDKVERLQLVLAQACNTLSVNSLLELDVGAPGVSKVLSAISYFIPMALLALYSKGQTNTELMKALNVTTKDDIRSSFPVLIKSIRALQGRGLSIAYKIYVNDPYKLSASFKNDSVAIIDAAAENVNFNNPCQAANTINKWVSDSTKGNVKNLVCEDMFNCMTRMVLANAIYFKGVWQQEFNPKLTQSSNFYVNCHKTTKVKMMQQQGKFSYTYSPDVDAQLVDIPFQNNSMSFVLVLPSKRDGLTNVLEKFRDPQLLNKALSGLHPQSVTIFMPKFDISTKFDIEDVLKLTGVKTIFGPEAEFNGIVVPDEALYVSKAVQEAIITVNEKGAEASAATVADVVGTTALPRPPQPKIIVRADHPFIYGLRLNSVFVLGGSFYG